MVIVLIHWKIKPKQKMVDRFLEFWKKEAIVNDRRGLVGEFLTESHSNAEYDWITWGLGGCERKYRTFINIGYWSSAEEFKDQIGQYFDTSSGKKDFEAKRRVRTVMKPKCWRIGDASLPSHDSGGVL